MSLTKRQIDSAIYSGSSNARCVLWDDDPRGLGLRIYPSGRKAFIVTYRNSNGVKRFQTLGDFGVLTLDDARRSAKRVLLAVEDQADPLAEKRTLRLEAKTGTVQALFETYVEARTKDPNRPMKRPDAALWYGKKFIYPKFGSRPWRDVHRNELREWHAGIAKPYNANRALQSLRAAFYWRLWQEDDSPGNRQRESDTRNPCAGIALRQETKRQVRLELTELPKLQLAIDAETGDPFLRTFFRFVLATGCRRSEALKLKWADVDPATSTRKGGAVTFRDTKNRSDRVLPLSPYAAALLKGLPRIAANPHVFVGRVRGTHLQSPAKAWQRIRKSAGLTHLRIHDLRRTFGSWLGDAGFTAKQIGTVLGHKSNVTSTTYMVLGDKSKQSAADAVGNLLRPRKRSAKTEQLRRRRA